MERVERRGSIARAFNRIRTAMKRRRPMDKHTVRNDKPVAETVDVLATKVGIPFEQSAVRHGSSKTTPPGAYGHMPTDSAVTGDHRLEADADDDNDTEEPLLPMASHRPGISDSKARDLFSRYGLLYDAERHISDQGPPTKLRRVERPIRLRVHWSCHECDARFGMEKTCVSCGHRKCEQCSRHPPKRVKEILENGRYLMEQSELSRQEVASCDDDSSKPSTGSTPTHSALPSPSLDLDTSIDADGDAGLPLFNYAIYARPSATVRMCESDYRHVRCEQYSRLSLKTDRWNQGSTRPQKMVNGEVPMMKAVRRVYRKPRQRVRYTCEHCTTLLLEGDRCRECGHDRFSRDPPKRAPTQFDAEVLQLVTNRLAAHGGGFGLSPGVTAS